MEEATEIDLTEIKHLIGLPGAGKTRLLYRLATWVARQGRRACFLFPSIEVAPTPIEFAPC
jgi:ABC-type cobalamin transport system ATPase subunit